MSAWLYCASAGGLFAIGLYGLLAHTDIVRRLLAANLMLSAVFLYLILTATLSATPPHPVPQAMVLTGIVVSVSITAFALVLVRCLRTAHAREDDTHDGAHDIGVEDD